MKLTSLLLFICMFQINAKTYSQKQKFNLDLREVSVQQVLTEIESVSDFKFFANTAEIDVSRRIPSLTSKGETIDKVLQKLFKGTTVEFEIFKKQIILKTRNSVSGESSLVPQNPTISGKVTDNKGLPLAGVTILIPGTSTGTYTNFDGNFKLELPEKAEKITFSFIGYKTQEIALEGRTVLNISLEEDVESLEEVVITGLFERSKQTYTGSAVSIKREELQAVDNDNLLKTLQVLEPSFQITENINLGSNPNALPNVVIRGGNSLPDITSGGNGDIFDYTSAPNVPLFILNGFEVTLQRVNDLNMNRIQNITILKDAAATVLYGSRAANGIVVIETVEPEDGNFRVSYNGALTLENPDLSSYNLLNAEQKLELEQAGGIYNNTFPYVREELDYLYNQRLAAARSGVDTDWLSIPVQNALGTQQNLYIDGGSSDNVLYGVGLNYQKNSGTMKGSSRSNISTNGYLSYRVKDFKFRNEILVSFNEGVNSPYGTFREYARMNPYWAPYDASGNTKHLLESVLSPNTGEVFNSQVNPLYNTTLNTVDESSYRNFTNNFVAEWKALNWLRFTSRISYQIQNDESDNFKPAQHTDFTNIPLERFYERGEYIKGYGRMSRLDGSLIGNVNKSFNKHVVYGSLGMSLLETKFSQEQFKVQGFPNSNLDQLLAGNRYPENEGPSGSESISRTAGYFVNGGYAYDNRYFVDASYRLDGSSQFGTNKRFAPFWSLGGGWNIHKESFMDHVNFIDRLKLRYSYGYTGSQNFPSFMGITTSKYYTDSDYRYNIGTYLLGYGNEDLKWQRTSKSNFGLDTEFFDRKLSLTFDYFVEKTQGSVISVTTAPSTGFSSYNENIGDVVNKGWEFKSRYMLYRDMGSRNQISLFLNIFHAKGTIQSISNKLEELNEENANSLSTSPLPRYVEGRSTSAIWAVPSLGIDPSTGREIYLTREGNYTTVYNPIDQIVAGDSRSDIEGSFGTNMEYKGVGVNLYFGYRIGGQTYNQTLVDRVEGADLNYNVDKRVYDDRWRVPGDETFFKGVVDPDGYSITSNTYASTRFVQDYNWLRLSNASIYYRFSEKLNQSLGLQNAKITLLTGDGFFFSSVKQERGLDYPFSRSFTLQFQTSF
ncbi:SusC/RagA family TonB-linked outer membrane protein [Flavivirga sp. 57AJ16]|uniref:SusC/RagA family TonB-linked outer membrane protein n=1 Tax=Flavivirga sp. 57AJ16 TaxID=3025307 RepID=UPI0023659796|nr:SusC/RagA family TonB-linked outer membrane protein [Flavivirga sp. 57AJ16]